MKNYIKILISCFCLFLFALACTKEVRLITEVEFELSEQHTAEGYVNQGLPSTFTIVPEEVLENHEYTITYEVLDGEGHFEDMEGNRVDPGKGWPVSEGLSAPLVYMGSKTGGHRVKITGANNFGISQDIEVTYELTDVPVVWEASSELSELELEKPVDVSLVFERLDTDLEVGYQAVYGFGSGAGSLGPSEENGYAPKGEYGPIVPGTYPLVFTPLEIGPQQLVFTLRDSNGQEIEAGVDFNVVDFIEVISITLSGQDTIKMKLGDEIPPAFTFDPPNATDQEVTVVSSDPDVVFIDENNVCIAVGLGTAVVTVTSVSNPDASDTVTVEVIPPDRVPVTDIDVSQADPGATGAQRQLTATVLPDNATDPTVNWSSSDDTIATVDGNGILTGLTAGTVTITATSVSDPEVSGSILVEITGVSLQSANDIEAFALNGQIETATIDTQAHTVSVTVPEGTPLNVAPVLLIVSEGANVAPALLQVRDFTSPVEYTVTSGNGTEQVWTVTAKVLVLPVAGGTDITAFGLPGQNGSDIDTENHTITVNVPDGTNLNVAPQVLEISPGATVAPAIGQVRDFSGAVTYTVSPETGTPQVWTVNVTVSQPTGSDLNAITGFALPVQNSVAINDVNHTITVNVPNGTDLNVVPSQLDISTGANIEPGPASQQDFSQPVNYTVTAENGSPQVWTVNVVTETSSEKSIDSFVINGISGTFNGTDISVTLPFGTDVTALSPIIEFFGQSVNPASGTSIDFTNNVTYTVTAEDNSSLDYTVSVTVEADTNTAPVVSVNGIADITLPTNSVDLVGSATDEGGTIVNYTWTQDSGPAATITDPSSSVTTATDLVAGNYVFRLTATDNDTGTGSNTVSFTVNEAANLAPVVSVNDISNITLPTNSVDLSGSATDNDGTIVNYAWTQDSGPAATITDPSSSVTTATDLVAGNYVFRLTATDNDNDTGSKTVSFTVNEAANLAPVVSVNDISNITLPTNSVDLSGSATDNDGTIVNYAWTQDNGPAATITDPSSSITTATDLVAGNYVFRLTATDNDNDTGSNTVAFTVNEAANVAPVAVADNFTVSEAGDLNVLILTNDTDSEGDDLTVNWVGGSPANIGQTIGGSNGGLFTITAGGNLTFDTNGEFDGLNDGDSQTTTVQYRVTDGNSNSNTATVSVTVTGVDAPSSENDITQFTLSPTSGNAILDYVNHTATINVPFGTDLLVAPTNLVVSAGATVSPLGNVERDFSNPVDYTVMAENGDSQVWQVIVNVEADTRSNENDITQFTLSPTSGNAILDDVNHTATINVPFGTDLLVAPTNLVVSAGATVSPLGNVERDFSNSVDYTVMAENGDSQVWQVIVNVNSPPAFVFSNGHAVGSGLSSITGTLTINSPTAFEIFAISDAQIVVVTLSLNPGNSYSATANHGSVESVLTPEIPIGTYTYTISITGDNGQGYVMRKE
ncbi:PKD domain-containing protein [Zobellia uliginosa]|uniref:PKD domain-containing protein n=1 Tax=Zobellia uliginosa TaxID=143224 RepID=UPI0026E44B12|nr:Ig-like domain-containing protein [Zobellia uliginosa]MDO6517842.1 Ig-like domain-containing protein [Zobellia uliginosa]